MIRHQLGEDPFQKNVFFMFCGRSPTKIKCLVWEGDGFLLLYKRLQEGRYQWPRTTQEGLKHLLTEIPKHMDDTNLDFIEELLPWTDELPQECHKTK